jgi:hypothetical protein
MRLYALEEARAMLPDVIPVVTRLRDAYLELRAISASVAAQRRGASGDGHLLADPWSEAGKDRVDVLNAAVHEAAKKLDAWGIEIKDPEKGLIDFYHEREGRVVYLCFHLGEEDIGYWHELAAGFAGRQPL